MADISAKDVKTLRDATGAGMLDAKKALVDNDGDFDAAARWLRERGLGKAAERSGRDNAQGAVTLALVPGAGALVQLRSETDFVAKSAQFVDLAEELARLVAERGESAVDERKEAIDGLKVTLGENIELGRVVRLEATPGHILEGYLHEQNGRGINGVLVEIEGGSPELAHDIAVHVAFGQPGSLNRDEVPTEAIDAERASLEAETRNEGKPEQSLPKIVEGKLNGWYKRIPGGVLLEQPYAKDDKQTIGQLVGDARIVRFAQVLIGQ